MESPPTRGGAADDPKRSRSPPRSHSEALDGVEKPSFSPSFWLALAINNPLGRIDITEQDARDWFDWIWPVYSEYRPIRAKHRHKLRIARFWIHLQSGDIDKARSRAANVLRGKANARFEKRLASSSPPTPPRTDLPPLRVSRGVGHG